MHQITTPTGIFTRGYARVRPFKPRQTRNENTLGLKSFHIWKNSPRQLNVLNFRSMLEISFIIFKIARNISTSISGLYRV